MGAFMRPARGSVLALTLVLVTGVALATKLFTDLMAVSIAAQKAQTAADFALTSALRVRAQSLETVAARWDAFGFPITVTAGTLEAPAGLTPAIAAGADALRRALSGFQGRITAALTVAVEANGGDRAQLRQTLPAGLRLGLEAQRAALSSPGSPTVDIDGLWYRRTWTGAAQPAGIELTWRTPRTGGAWETPVPAIAHLAWDADAGNPAVSANGNGGFSPDWANASAGAMFRPNQFPVFRADAGSGT